MLMAANGDDESHSGADATLSPDAVDAVNKAKAAVEALPGCAGKVSCADILAMAARDVVSLVKSCSSCAAQQVSSRPLTGVSS
jgi:peroxidase